MHLDFQEEAKYFMLLKDNYIQQKYKYVKISLFSKR